MQPKIKIILLSQSVKLKLQVQTLLEGSSKLIFIYAIFLHQRQNSAINVWTFNLSLLKMIEQSHNTGLSLKTCYNLNRHFSKEKHKWPINMWKDAPYHLSLGKCKDAWYRVLRAGALGWPRGMRWGRRWEGGSGWGTHVHPWLIQVNVWQKPLQYCKVISLQFKLIN